MTKKKASAKKSGRKSAKAAKPAPKAQSPKASRPEASSKAEPAPAKPRRRWLKRLLLAAILLPALAWGALEVHAWWTRLPDLGDDLAVLLPAEGTLLCAELPAPSEIAGALRGSPLWRALSGAEGIRELPGDDERSLRHADEDAAGFRRTAGLLSLLKKPLLCALVDSPEDGRPSLIVLTRSEPGALKTIIGAVLSFSWSHQVSSETYKRAAIHAYRDLEDPLSSFQYAQLGDVLAINHGSAQPANLKRLVDAWAGGDRDKSFAPLLEKARKRLASAAPEGFSKGGKRLFAVADGRATLDYLLAQADRLAGEDPKDALFWLDLAEWLKNADDHFALEARTLDSPERLEFFRLSSADGPVWEGEAPPKAELPAVPSGSAFLLEASDIAGATLALEWIFPRWEAENKDANHLRWRIGTLRQPRPAESSRPARLLVEGAKGPDGALRFSGGIFAPEGAGDAWNKSLEAAFDRTCTAWRYHAKPRTQGPHWAVEWPGQPAGGEPLPEASGEPGAWARIAFDAGSLSAEEFDALGLALSAHLRKPDNRREFLSWLEALRGVRAEYASRKLGGGFAAGSLKLIPAEEAPSE